MKTLLNSSFGIMLILIIIFTGCAKEEPGDEPEDFFSMKKSVKTPFPSFNLNDFSLKPDDGFLLAGSSDILSSPANRAVVISLNPDGKTIWTSDFVIATFLNTMADYAVLQNNGLTMVSGSCFNDWGNQSRFVVTLDAAGKVTDHRIFPAPAGYQALSSHILPRSDGNFYLVNSYYPYDWDSPHLLEVDLMDADGNLIWDKSFGNILTYADQVTLSSSDGLIITGTLEHGIYDDSPDFLFILTDKDGNEIIHKAFGTNVNWEYGNFCIEEDGKGFVFSGTTAQSAAASIFRINSDGEVSDPIFVAKYKNYTDKNYILKTKSPGYLMMSYTYNYFLFVRLDENFSVKWSTSQIIRVPSQGYGTWSSCHLVPARNGKFAFAYVSDDNILLFRTRSY